MSNTQRHSIDLSLFPELKRLEIRTKRSISADFLGQYRTAFRGTGLLYSDLREYQPGDEVKNIHWKASAKTDKVYVKSYEEDRHLRFLLVVDISRSTDYGNPKTKHIRALEFGALISLLAHKNKDSIGLCLFSGEVEEFLPPKHTRSQYREVLYSLLLKRKLSQATNLNLALEHIERYQKRKTTIFLLSDFLCPQFTPTFKRLSARHEIIGVFIEDDLDFILPRAGLVEFVDAESGGHLIFDSSNKKSLHRLKVAYEKRFEALKRTFQDCGADLIKIRDNPIAPLVALMRTRIRRHR